MTALTVARQAHEQIVAERERAEAELATFERVNSDLLAEHGRLTRAVTYVSKAERDLKPIVSDLEFDEKWDNREA